MCKPATEAEAIDFIVHNDAIIQNTFFSIRTMFETEKPCKFKKYPPGPSLQHDKTPFGRAANQYKFHYFLLRDHCPVYVQLNAQYCRTGRYFSVQFQHDIVHFRDGLFACRKVYTRVCLTAYFNMKERAKFRWFPRSRQDNRPSS